MYPQSLSPVQQVDFSLLLVFLFAAAVLTVLTAITCWFLWRYHHRRNPVASDIRGNLKAEIAWTLIPTLMVMGLFYYGWTGYKALRTVPEDAMPVNVTARTFSWTFTYANGKHSNYLAVPVDTPVRLNMRSMDVIHSLYIPAFRIKMDTVPGMQTYAWFSAARAGSYDIYCAEYCGVGHSKMLSTVKAMNKADFEAWLAEQSADTGPEAGFAFMDSQGCFSCHATDGSDAGSPPLHGLYGKKVTVLDGNKEKEVVADDAYLQESITDPGKLIVKGYDNTMPPYTEATPEQMESMLEYIRSIGSEGAGGSAGSHDHAGHGAPAQPAGMPDAGSGAEQGAGQKNTTRQGGQR